MTKALQHTKANIPNKTQLSSTTINTPIGQMLAIASNVGLYLLSFQDDLLENKVEDLVRTLNAEINDKISPLLTQLRKEVSYYFQHKLTQFKTPCHLVGTPFETTVWEKLKVVPYGHKWSYKEVAHAIKNPKSVRAVGRANGRNKHCLIIPCHRIINANGKLGGYSAGLSRKQWLLNHESERAHD